MIRKQPRPRTHYSREEIRLTAIYEEGKLAYSAGISYEANPKTTPISQNAWWKGWNAALNEAHGEEHV